MPSSEDTGWGVATRTPAPRPATQITPVGDNGGAVKRAAGGPAPRDTWTLIDRAKAGDTDAFGELYQRYRLAVQRFVYRRVADRDLAADLTQDVFVRALRGIAGLRWEGKDPGAWFITIARNLIADHYKSARIRYASNVPPEWWTGDEDRGITQVDPDPIPEDAVILAATRAAVLAAIAALPDRQRRVIELRYLADLTVAETCDLMGMTDGAVKTLTFRAVRSLARALPRTAVEAAA